MALQMREIARDRGRLCEMCLLAHLLAVDELPKVGLASVERGGGHTRILPRVEGCAGTRTRTAGSAAVSPGAGASARCRRPTGVTAGRRTCTEHDALHAAASGSTLAVGLAVAAAAAGARLDRPRAGRDRRRRGRWRCTWLLLRRGRAASAAGAARDSTLAVGLAVAPALGACCCGRPGYHRRLGAGGGGA